MEKVIEIVRIRQEYIERSEDLITIRCPKDAATLAMKEIGDEDREVLLVFVLNTKNQIIAIHRCHIGSINASIVHPREIMKSIILNNGSSFMIFHNHPSQNTGPSPEDIQVTNRLKEVGIIMGIDLLDHIIVSETNFTSLKEKGYL